ncbi:MAG: C4-dicarboxylate ABC transporter substrate-binding protein [Hoeflea sp.]|nr:MAG: C4-dicarboxylate ABC transporter substrate-binding protein [Hoeflea sp.]
MKRIMAAIVGAVLVAGAAQAETLNFSVGMGPNSSITKAVNAYAERVEAATDGEVKIKVFPLELVGLPEMAPGIRDGLTDIGYMATPYFPSEFAHSNFLAELSMALNLFEGVSGIAGNAYAGAMTEFITTKCPECLAEFKAQNHVYMGHMSTSPYSLLCNGDVKTIDDLKGKRLRAGGAVFKRFSEHFGAVGVQLPANEAYEALSQGVLDCAILSVPELTNYRLQDVVTSVTLGVPGNVFGGTVSGNFNRDVWAGLTPEQREDIFKEQARLASDMTFTYASEQERNLKETKDLGKSVYTPDAEMQAALKDFAMADQDVVAKLFAENYGVDDAAEMQAEFLTVLERWLDLVKDVKNAEELAKIYWTKNYSKLDPNGYGLD